MLNFTQVPADYKSLTLEQLVEACQETGGSAAWEEFVRRTNKLVWDSVFSALRRWYACRSTSPDDVVQEVYMRISANRAAALRSFEFRYPNAVYGYLRAIAASVAHDYCRSLNAEKRGAGKVELLGDTIPTATRGGATELDQKIRIMEIERVLKEECGGPSASRDRAIFWLYYRQGFTAKAIAGIPGIGLTAKGVESSILRLTRMVREHLGGLLPATVRPEGAGAKKAL